MGKWGTKEKEDNSNDPQYTYPTQKALCKSTERECSTALVDKIVYLMFVLPSRPSTLPPRLIHLPQCVVAVGILDDVPGGVPGAALGLVALALATRGCLVRTKKLREESDQKGAGEENKVETTEVNEKLPN